MKTALRMFFFMMILTGVVYPLLMTGLSQIFMPYLAKGSLIEKDGQILGSALIAQKTSQEHYFWSRPSAIDYDPIYPSGGSNMGPISAKLKQVVSERKERWGSSFPPSLLLYASGSGLDPHISQEAAYFQISRVAKARGVSESHIYELINKLTEGKKWGFLGEGYVNVLILNRELDEHSQR